MSKVLRFFVMLHCVWILCWRSFAVAVYARFNKKNRKFTTEYLHKGGVSMLKSVKATYKATLSKSYKENEPKLKIFVSNHLSLYDLPLIVSALPGNIRMVVKKEILKVPFLGKAAVASEQIIVDRKNKENNKNFYEVAAGKLKSGISVWGFPEGTRSRNGDLLPFKLGIFRLAQDLGAQIIPVGVIGTNKILAADNFLPHFNQDLELKVGDPIASDSFPAADVQKLADLARERILGLTQPASQ